MGLYLLSRSPASSVLWLVGRHGQVQAPAPHGSASEMEQHDLQKVICTEEQNHKHCCKVVSPQEKMGCSKVPEGIAAAELWLG